MATAHTTWMHVAQRILIDVGQSINQYREIILFPPITGKNKERNVSFLESS